jgi:integrase
MVWTPEQTGRFLDVAAADRLYPLYHLIAFRGLRRGEACGLHWTDLNPTAHTLTVRWQLLQYGWETGLDDPKTDASADVIALDTATAAVLTDHQQRQDAERAAAGLDWSESGLVFTTPTGQPLHPADVTDQLDEQRGCAPARRRRDEGRRPYLGPPVADRRFGADSEGRLAASLTASAISPAAESACCSQPMDDEPHGHAQIRTPRDCVRLPRTVWYTRPVVTASTIVPMDSTTRVVGTSW